MNCCALPLVFSLFIKIFTSEEEAQTTPTFRALHYWRSLKISERFLSLILFRLNLAIRCVLCLLMPTSFPGCLPLFFLSTYKSTSTPSPLSRPARTRRTPFSLTPMDKIYDVCWSPKMIRQKGKRILIHLTDSNRMGCKMNRYTQLSSLCNTHCIFLRFTSRYIWQTRRIQYWATDLWKIYKIWIKSDIQFNTTDLPTSQEGHWEGTVGPSFRTIFKVYVGNRDVYVQCVQHVRVHRFMLAKASSPEPSLPGEYAWIPLLQSLVSFKQFCSHLPLLQPIALKLDFDRFAQRILIYGKSCRLERVAHTLKHPPAHPWFWLKELGACWKAQRQQWLLWLKSCFCYVEIPSWFGSWKTKLEAL